MTFKLKRLLSLSVALTASLSVGSASISTLANAETSATVLARTQATDAAARLETLATIFSYPYEEQTATTLYIKKLPVLTFLSSGDVPEDTAAIAQQISTDINALAEQAEFDATEFSVSWKADGEYDLLYGEESVVTLNEAVFLADTTRNLEQDALAAVNRFRRLLGGADPITEVANKPKPKVVVPVVAAAKVVRAFQGHASWYGPGFHGRLTANGERFNQNAMTAAHKTLPFGTKIRVTNLNNGRSVVVRINDRGPFIGGRVIDLSKGSAQQIGLVASGVANVKLEILSN